VAQELIAQPDGLDLFIIDYQMGQGQENGLELCRRVKNVSDKPVIMLTGESSTEVIVSCLYAGADQYITKPYVLEELLARVHVTLRNAGVPEAGSENGTFEGIGISENNRKLISETDSVSISERELEVAQVLFANPEQVIRRDYLYSLIFGTNLPPFNRAIDIIVGRLRKKVAQLTDDVVILSARNSGYMLTRRPADYKFDSQQDGDTAN
jgi:DNA-binding response OmpR family regulator